MARVRAPAVRAPAAEAIPNPALFPRRIALFVTGLSPQIVTETLWSLARREPPFIPTELALLTTAEGRRRALLMLLPTSATGSDDGPAALAALGREIGVPDLPTRLPPAAIHVVRSPSGTSLEDIADEAANIAAADAITALVRSFTADPAAALHVSIAGGRKTMGFLAGYALSLFGRPQDRLSHVLVPEPFQSHPQFFFPPATARVLFSRDNHPISTADATVRLAEIPFVRLRDGFSPRALARASSFAAAVAELQHRFAPPRLVIDISAGTAEAGGVPLKLPPSLFGTLLWFARDRLASEQGIDWRTADPAPLLAAMKTVAPATLPAMRRLLGHGIDRAWLAEKKTRLNNIVSRSLGAAGAQYRVESVGKRPRTCYRLAIPPEGISILGESHGRGGTEAEA